MSNPENTENCSIAEIKQLIKKNEVGKKQRKIVD